MFPTYLWSTPESGCRKEGGYLGEGLGEDWRDGEEIEEGRRKHRKNE